MLSILTNYPLPLRHWDTAENGVLAYIDLRREVLQVDDIVEEMRPIGNEPMAGRTIIKNVFKCFWVKDRKLEVIRQKVWERSTPGDTLFNAIDMILYCYLKCEKKLSQSFHRAI